ncbi:helix-turn-helix domain-containing protein [Streptomyces sp. 147326]|uniref:helix-turn-helix domain-containing protein n=1 Tax=Streptomyces sp. 147326 TaxID=3074379 RepID=UPI0038571A1D
MPESRRTKELPASLLIDPEMTDACHVRDFARIFRLVKTRAGMYPSMIARLCELTPSRVGEVIAGQRQLLHMDVIERIADGLRIPGHMLGLARRQWETSAALVVSEQEPLEFVHLPVEPRPLAALPGVEVDSILAMAAGTNPSLHSPGAPILDRGLLATR